jgi:stress response protein YsnF
MDKLTANNLTNVSVAQRLDIGTTITDTSSPDPSPNTVWSTTGQDTLATDNSHTIAPKEHDRHTLELLAERPLIDIQRVVTGTVKFSKQVRTQTVNVPVTLTQEVLVIEHTGYDNPILANQLTGISLTDKDLVKIVAPKTTTNTSHIMINGEPVTVTDKPLEVVISQQVATVSISTEVAEQVNITTKAHSYEQTVPVTLRHEELVVEETKLDTPQMVSRQ